MLLGLLRLPSCLCRWQTDVTALCRKPLVQDNPYPTAHMIMAFKTAAFLTASKTGGGLQKRSGPPYLLIYLKLCLCCWAGS